MTIERLRLLLADLPPEHEVLIAGPGGAYAVLSASTSPRPKHIGIAWMECERVDPPRPPRKAKANP